MHKFLFFGGRDESFLAEGIQLFDKFQRHTHTPLAQVSAKIHTFQVWKKAA